MNYRIVHKTTFSYTEPASLSQNELFLHPRETGTQQVVSSELLIEPQPQYLHRRTDFFGNIAHVFMVQHPHTKLSVTATSRVVTAMPVTPPPQTSPAWETVAHSLAVRDTAEVLDACQFVFPSPLIETPAEAEAFARPSFPPGTPVLDGAMDLMGRIFKDFTYDKSATTVDTSVTQALGSAKGVCQDFAHVAIACLRSLGLAARYVSGYLKTLPPPGKPRLVGADASHAWFSLFVPGTGWVDLDPTNNLIPGDTHITIAWGRDYGDVTPVKGVVMGGGTHTLSVMVDVLEEMQNQ
jgi:transglutaminase-like putative cysteine protease